MKNIDNVVKLTESLSMFNYLSEIYYTAFILKRTLFLKKIASKIITHFCYLTR